MTSIWDDLVSPDDRRALDPGPPGRLDPAPDVLVVGGGIVGLATAALCARAGLGRVTVIERDRCAAGPSGSAAGGLTPDFHRLAPPSESFVELGRESLALARRLDAEWDGALGVRTVDWIFGGAPLPEHVVQAAGGTLLDAAAARAAEPELAEVRDAALFPGQGHVEPLRYAAAFARRAGAVVTGVEMLGLEASKGRVTRVRTSRGEVSPGALVLATGTVPKQWWGLAMEERVKGHLIATEPAPFRMRVAVASLVLVLQLLDGTIVGGGTVDAGDESPDVRDDVVGLVRREMARAVPATAGLATRRAWCCFRPGLLDRPPVIDRAPGLENAWVTARHLRTGLLMAPATGRAIASWIQTGKRPPEVESFGLVGNGLDSS